MIGDEGQLGRARPFPLYSGTSTGFHQTEEYIDPWKKRHSHFPSNCVRSELLRANATVDWSGYCAGKPHWVVGCGCFHLSSEEYIPILKSLSLLEGAASALMTLVAFMSVEEHKGVVAVDDTAVWTFPSRTLVPLASLHHDRMTHRIQTQQ
mmetsp:Transcript_375/g.649  ORF Transcript_375/g.649 Transcript_375/m.649 type:complete len:151 (-) Transcript_375:374-826(-)